MALVSPGSLRVSVSVGMGSWKLLVVPSGKVVFQPVVHLVRLVRGPAARISTAAAGWRETGTVRRIPHSLEYSDKLDSAYQYRSTDYGYVR